MIDVMICEILLSMACYIPITPDELEELRELFLEIDDERYDNPDNFRLSVDGDEESTIDYDTKVSCGCCGSFDNHITLKSGLTVHYGWNYGH